MIKSNRLNPGFVRVFIPSRGKTTRIRQQHANNPSFLSKHGMVLMPEPALPPVSVPVPPVAPPPPLPTSPPEAKQPEMKPTKVKA